MTTKILFSLLFLLPLLVLPFGLSPYEIPKIFLGFFGIELFVLSALWNKNYHHLRSINRSFLVVYIILFLLSIIHLSLYPTSITLLGNSYRYQGVFLLWHLMLFSFFSAKLSLPKSKTYAILLLVICFLSFVIKPNASGRIIGTLGDPNFLAVTINFLWPLAIYYSRIKNKLFLSFLFLLSLFTVFLTRSQSGLLAFVLQTILSQLGYLDKLGQLGQLFSRFLLVLCFVFLFISLIFPFLQPTKQFEDRKTIWKMAWETGLQKPLFGHGIGNTQAALASTSKAHNNIFNFQSVDSAHNLLLDWWVQGGIIGLIIILLLNFYTIKLFILNNNYLYLSLLIGVLTASLFNPLGTNGLLYLWYLIGQSVGNNDK